jgi:protein SCO1/2
MTRRLALALLAAVCLAPPVSALAPRADNPLLATVGFDARPGTALPLRTVLRDADGRPQQLATWFDGRAPVAMLFGYYHCRRLCETAIDALARAATLAHVDARLLFVGIDPRESIADAARKRDALRRAYGDAAMHWRFLVGDDTAIDVLTRAAGLRTTRDASGDIVHAAGVLVLTPDGRIARLLPGVAVDPQALRDALAQARRGETSAQRPNLFVQLCSHYDPATGRYSVRVLYVLRLVALLMAFALVAAIVVRRRARGASR